MRAKTAPAPARQTCSQRQAFFGQVRAQRQAFDGAAGAMGLQIYKDVLVVDDVCDEDDVLEMPIERPEYAISNPDEAECFVVDERHMRAPSLGLEPSGQGFVLCEGAGSFDFVFDEPVHGFAVEISGLGSGILTVSLGGTPVRSWQYSLGTVLGGPQDQGQDAGLDQVEVQDSVLGQGKEGRALVGVLSAKPFEVVSVSADQEGVRWGGTIRYAAA